MLARDSAPDKWSSLLKTNASKRYDGGHVDQPLSSLLSHHISILPSSNQPSIISPSSSHPHPPSHPADIDKERTERQRFSDYKSLLNDAVQQTRFMSRKMLNTVSPIITLPLMDAKTLKATRSEEIKQFPDTQPHDYSRYTTLVPPQYTDLINTHPLSDILAEDPLQLSTYRSVLQSHKLYEKSGYMGPPPPPLPTQRIRFDQSKLPEHILHQSIEEGLTLHPTLEEWADPNRYIRKITMMYAYNHGIIRIIPPQHYSPPFSLDPDTTVFHTRTQLIGRFGTRGGPSVLGREWTVSSYYHATMLYGQSIFKFCAQYQDALMKKTFFDLQRHIISQTTNLPCQNATTPTEKLELPELLFTQFSSPYPAHLKYIKNMCLFQQKQQHETQSASNIAQERVYLYQLQEEHKITQFSTSQLPTPHQNPANATNLLSISDSVSNFVDDDTAALLRPKYINNEHSMFETNVEKYNKNIAKRAKVHDLSVHNDNEGIWEELTQLQSDSESFAINEILSAEIDKMVVNIGSSDVTTTKTPENTSNSPKKFGKRIETPAVTQEHINSLRIDQHYDTLRSNVTNKFNLNGKLISLPSIHSNPNIYNIPTHLTHIPSLKNTCLNANPPISSSLGKASSGNNPHKIIEEQQYMWNRYYGRRLLLLGYLLSLRQDMLSALPIEYYIPIMLEYFHAGNIISKLTKNGHHLSHSVDKYDDDLMMVAPPTSYLARRIKATLCSISKQKSAVHTNYLESRVKVASRAAPVPVNKRKLSKLPHSRYNILRSFLESTKSPSPTPRKKRFKPTIDASPSTFAPLAIPFTATAPTSQKLTPAVPKGKKQQYGSFDFFAQETDLSCIHSTFSPFITSPAFPQKSAWQQRLAKRRTKQQNVVVIDQTPKIQTLTDSMVSIHSLLPNHLTTSIALVDYEKIIFSHNPSENDDSLITENISQNVNLDASQKTAIIRITQQLEPNKSFTNNIFNYGCLYQLQDPSNLASTVQNVISQFISLLKYLLHHNLPLLHSFAFSLSSLSNHITLALIKTSLLSPYPFPFPQFTPPQFHTPTEAPQLHQLEVLWQSSITYGRPQILIEYGKDLPTFHLSAHPHPVTSHEQTTNPWYNDKSAPHWSDTLLSQLKSHNNFNGTPEHPLPLDHYPNSNITVLSEQWNPHIIAFIPGSFLSSLGVISGITKPSLYCGTYFSTFPWHIEDDYMLSMSANLTSSPKIWYGIPSSHADFFEELFSRFTQLGHKSIHSLANVITPQLIQAFGIKVTRLVQEPGHIILTSSRGYHSGFSAGFSCAEAVNLCSTPWLPFGRLASIKYRIEANRESIFALEMLLIRACLVDVEHNDFNMLYNAVNECIVDLTEIFIILYPNQAIPSSFYSQLTANDAKNLATNTKKAVSAQHLKKNTKNSRTKQLTNYSQISSVVNQMGTISHCDEQVITIHKGYSREEDDLGSEVSPNDIQLDSDIKIGQHLLVNLGEGFQPILLPLKENRTNQDKSQNNLMFEQHVDNTSFDDNEAVTNYVKATNEQLLEGYTFGDQRGSIFHKILSHYEEYLQEYKTEVLTQLQTYINDVRIYLNEFNNNLLSKKQPSNDKFTITKKNKKRAIDVKPDPLELLIGNIPLTEETIDLILRYNTPLLHYLIDPCFVPPPVHTFNTNKKPFVFGSKDDSISGNSILNKMTLQKYIQTVSKSCSEKETSHFTLLSTPPQKHYSVDEMLLFAACNLINNKVSNFKTVHSAKQNDVITGKRGRPKKDTLLPLVSELVYADHDMIHFDVTKPFQLDRNQFSKELCQKRDQVYAALLLAYNANFSAKDANKQCDDVNSYEFVLYYQIYRTLYNDLYFDIPTQYSNNINVNNGISRDIFYRFNDALRSGTRMAKNSKTELSMRKDRLIEQLKLTEDRIRQLKAQYEPDITTLYPLFRQRQFMQYIHHNGNLHDSTGSDSGSIEPIFSPNSIAPSHKECIEEELLFISSNDCAEQSLDISSFNTLHQYDPVMMYINKLHMLPIKAIIQKEQRVNTRIKEDEAADSLEQHDVTINKVTIQNLGLHFLFNNNQDVAKSVPVISRLDYWDKISIITNKRITIDVLLSDFKLNMLYYLNYVLNIDFDLVLDTKVALSYYNSVVVPLLPSSLDEVSTLITSGVSHPSITMDQLIPLQLLSQKIHYSHIIFPTCHIFPCVLTTTAHYYHTTIDIPYLIKPIVTDPELIPHTNPALALVPTLNDIDNTDIDEIITAFQECFALCKIMAHHYTTSCDSASIKNLSASYNRSIIPFFPDQAAESIAQYGTLTPPPRVPQENSQETSDSRSQKKSKEANPNELVPKMDLSPLVKLVFKLIQSATVLESYSIPPRLFQLVNTQQITHQYKQCYSPPIRIKINDYAPLLIYLQHILYVNAQDNINHVNDSDQDELQLDLNNGIFSIHNHQNYRDDALLRLLPSDRDLFTPECSVCHQFCFNSFVFCGKQLSSLFGITVDTFVNEWLSGKPFRNDTEGNDNDNDITDIMFVEELSADDNLESAVKDAKSYHTELQKLVVTCPYHAKHEHICFCTTNTEEVNVIPSPLSSSDASQFIYQVKKYVYHTCQNKYHVYRLDLDEWELIKQYMMVGRK